MNNNFCEEYKKELLKEIISELTSIEKGSNLDKSLERIRSITNIIINDNSKFNYIVDIDGTICEDIPNEEFERFPLAKVIDGAVEFYNKKYESGHYVVFFTARLECHREVTEQWLKKNGFKFHKLITEKPRGGNYIIIDNLDGKYIKFRGSYK